MLVKIELINKLRENGISIFYGDVCSKDHFHAFLPDGKEFLRFCTINGVKSVFVAVNEREEVEEIDFDKIQDKLTTFFESEVKSALQFGFNRFITKDYYNPAFEKVKNSVEKDRSKYAELLAQNDIVTEEYDEIVDEENDLFETGALDSVFLFALFNGGTVDHLIMFDEDEDESDNKKKAIPSEKELFNMYANQLRNGIAELRQGAFQENERILREMKEELLNKIKVEIISERKWSGLTTQKARNEYADLKHAEWQNKGDYEWLTKKDVRSLVEKMYFLNI